MKLFIIILSLIISANILAEELDYCKDSVIGKAAVFSGGRIKPLLVHAEDRMFFITSDKKATKSKGLENFCSLSFKVHTEVLKRIHVKIYNNEVKKVLHMKMARKSSFLDLETFLQSGNTFTHLMRSDGNNRLQSIFGVYSERINVLRQVISGEDFKIYIDGEWVFPSMVQDKGKIEAYLLGHTLLRNKKVSIEYYLKKIKPFYISIFLIFVAIFLMIIRQNMIAVVLVTAAALDLQLLAMIVRGYIAGRIPLSNMYETVMFAGFAANIMGLIFYYKWKERVVVLTGLILNFFTLFMMLFATGMLDSSINPLMPVLKNNFWLGIHVFTVIVAYASLGASWIISNYAIMLDLIGKKREEIEGKYLGIISDTIRVGVVFLSAGIITGAMWADFAWGRFWGWDPKEVWSLIVLLIYMVILHGRYTNWINKRKFVFITAPAFLSVMMAWFGVNYVLATGLHSYGFSQGGTIFFLVFVSIQLGLSILHGIKAKNTQGI